MKPTPSFELSFSPNFAVISVVRRFVSHFYEHSLNDPDGTSRVALATHELLENAAKYSKDGETTIRIEVEPTTPKIVRITLRNRTELANIATLREILDGITNSEDSVSFYQALVAKNARQQHASAGLGLARISAEGEMRMTYKISGDVVEIEAVTSVGVGA